jgi:hypothetical protein
MAKQDHAVIVSGDMQYKSQHIMTPNKFKNKKQIWQDKLMRGTECNV